MIIACTLYAHFTNFAEHFNQNLCLQNIAIIVRYIASTPKISCGSKKIRSWVIKTQCQGEAGIRVGDIEKDLGRVRGTLTSPSPPHHTESEHHSHPISPSRVVSI